MLSTNSERGPIKMLNKVYVNGFRSLIDFDIELTSGLNIVVGPNGSGKTNFIDFISFVGRLASEGANNAVAWADGASSTFSSERFGRDLAHLDFAISGKSELTTSFFITDDDEEIETREIANYSWTCRITYDRRVPVIYISREEFVIYFEHESDFKVTRHTTFSSEGAQTRVKSTPANHSLQNQIWNHYRFDNPSESFNYTLENDLNPEVSIIQTLFRSSDFMNEIYHDLTTLKSIKIDPEVSKKPSPVTFSGSLESNGEGLSAVLYRLENRSKSTPQHRLKFDAFSSLVSWCNEINPNISKINIELDFVEALMRPSLTYEDSNKLNKYPFHRLSDGTVKWIALSTMLFTKNGYSAIEEPENFLHPQMQVTFIKMCRDILKNRDLQNQYIISTHSLTLLDQCLPEELIIFETLETRTVCGRVENAEYINKKLDSSRFGLGYLYRSGVVYGSYNSYR